MANASVKIGANISEYKAGMKECAQSMKDIQQEYSLASQKAKLLGDEQGTLKAKTEQLTAKIETQKEKIRLNTDYADKLRQQLEKLHNKESDLKTKISETEKALEQSKEQTGESSEETQKLSKELETLKSKLSNTEKSIETTTNRLENVKKQTEFATKELANMETELGQVQRKLSTLSLEKMGDGMQKAGDKISNAGEKLMGVTTAIAGVTTVSVKTFADFEAQMSKVGAISGATGEDLEKLGEKAKEMGAKTKFSATESGEAMEYMAMAGWKTGDMLNGIEGIMNLAAASGENLATTSDIVTDAMTAFGLSASGTTTIVKDGFSKEVANASHFADVLAAASSNSNTNVSMLGESFKYAAPVAGALGYSVEDTAVALGLMANSGIKASQGGTALRTTLTNLAKPTESIKAAMNYLGISLQNNDGSMKSLMEIMTDLRSSFGQCKMPMDEFKESLADIEAKYESGELTEKKYNEAVADLTEKAYGAEGALKAKYAATIAGKEGMSGLLSIVSAAPEDFEKLTNAIYDSDGAAEKMASTMIDNLAGKTTIMKSTLEGVSITIGEILAPKAEAAVEKVTNLAEKFLSLDKETQKNIVTMGAVVAAIAPALIIIGKLTHGIGEGITKVVDMSKSIQKMGGIMTLLTSPIALAIAAIAAITAVIITLWNTNEDFRNTVTQIWNGIKDAFKTFADGIKQRLDELGISFSDIAAAIKAVWQGFCNLLAPIIEGAFAQVQNIISTVLNLILGVFDLFKAIFTGDWEGAWNAVKDIVSTVWNAIKTTVTTGFNAVKTGVTNAVNEAKTAATTAFNGLKSAVTTAMNGTKSATTTAANAIKSGITTGFNGAKSAATTAFNELKNSVSSALNAAKSTVTSACSAIKSKFSSTQLKLPRVATDTLRTAEDAVSSALSTIRSKVSGISLSLPKINGGGISLPHISIFGQFSLNPPSIPQFSVDWYKTGGIMTRPTIFGANGTTLLAGGEAGSEAILPLTEFYKYITNLLDKKIREIGKQQIVYVEVNTYIDGDEVAKKTAIRVNGELVDDKRKERK